MTEEQRAAIERRDVSVVVSAGAGSGKTFVLTERYVSHLEREGARPRQMVAITFTERASREMRSRIRRMLRQRLAAADPPGEPFLGELPAAVHWRDCLRELETAPITTIHAFCGQLLRRYAVPAGLDPGFVILDELQAATLQAEAVQRTLQRLLTSRGDDPAARALEELIVLFGYPAVRSAVAELLPQADGCAWQEWLARSPEAIVGQWQALFAEVWLSWLRYVQAAEPKCVAAWRLLPLLERGGPTLRTRVAGIRQLWEQLQRPEGVGAAVEELLQLAQIRGTSAEDWPDDVLRRQVQEAFAEFRGFLREEVAPWASPGWETHGMREAARIGQQFVRVALAVAADYQQLKDRQDALDFQDLVVQARDLLREQAAVRQEVQNRYRFVLLDELQDTDPVQMELVELLCGPGLASGKLFAVGDHKQSIYRFRGAEVSLFVQLRQRLPESGRLQLSRNFRSQEGILRFVNALFVEHLEEFAALTADRPSLQPPNVAFLWAEPPVVAGERVAATTRRQAEAQAIAARIRQLLEDPTPRVLDRDTRQPRRVRPGDIALLFRSMTGVDLYEQALQEAGIDYYVIGGWAFFAQQEVYDIMHAVRAVENPHDPLSLVGALRSPLFQISDESLAILAEHPRGVWAGLHDASRRGLLTPSQQQAAARAVELLQRWRQLKDRMPIARLLQQMVADTAYDAALQLERWGERKLANLWKLIELAREFDRGGRFGLHAFAERLSDFVARQPREEQAATVPEKADVVRLMSIHQSKGLEFAVVIVPELSGRRQTSPRPLARWHRRLGALVRLPGELESLPGEGAPPPYSPRPHELGKLAEAWPEVQEEWRVFYVACTRAADLLILAGGLDGPAADPLPLEHNPWTLLLQERFDLRSGVCRTDPSIRAAVDICPAQEPVATYPPSPPQ